MLSSNQSSQNQQPEQPPQQSHSFFNTVANFAVAGYEKATNYVDNDAAKAVLISQRSTFEKTVQAAADLSDKAVEAVARGAEKLVSGDHHYQPDPLPNWLNPRLPILTVQSTLPFFFFYSGLVVYHKNIVSVISSPSHARSRYNIIFFSLPPENETEDPYQCGPMEGSFEPLFGKILWRTGILKKEDLCATQNFSTSRLLPPLSPQKGEEVTASLEGEGREMTVVNNQQQQQKKRSAGASEASSSGFDLLPDIPLGGTVSGSNSPFNSTRKLEEKKDNHENENDDDQQQQQGQQDGEKKKDGEGAEQQQTLYDNTIGTLGSTIGNYLNLNNTTTKENDGANDDKTPSSAMTAASSVPLTPNSAARATAAATHQRRSFRVAIKSIISHTLEALHPNFIFNTSSSNSRSRSAFSFTSYHFISFSFFTLTAVTSYLGLRKVAKQRGVAVKSLIPTVARFARDVMPLSWTGGVLDRFGSQPVDLSSTLQFGLTFGTCGAILHLFSGVTEAATGMFSQENANTRRELLDNKSRTEDEAEAQEQPQESNRFLRGAALASHYTSLVLDLNLTLQLCVLSPSLPPIVKLWPALFFGLVTRKQYLCDDKHTKSYLGSHTRWILYAGAIRHFAMLCESTPKNNNFLSHAFPRFLSLGLLPIHLAAFWLPMDPVRAFDERNGGLLRTIFGFVTGTAWSPGALAAANLAWTALYLTQGTSSMEDALPRIKTMGDTTLPLPLYLVSVEVLASIGKMLTNVA